MQNDVFFTLLAEKERLLIVFSKIIYTFAPLKTKFYT